MEHKIVSTTGSYKAVNVPRLPSHFNVTDTAGLQRRGYAPEEDWPWWAIWIVDVDADLLSRSKALRDMGFTTNDAIWETGDIFSEYTYWPYIVEGMCYESDEDNRVDTEVETNVVYARYGPEFCD